MSLSCIAHNEHSRLDGRSAGVIAYRCLFFTVREKEKKGAAMIMLLTHRADLREQIAKSLGAKGHAVCVPPTERM